MRKISMLKMLTNRQLLEKTESLAREERRITVDVLEHLREIEVRRAYIDIGYGSLYDYAVKHLKYSEASAYRRISAMRAIKDNPEIAKGVEDGKLNISTISQVQTFLRNERSVSNVVYSKEQKAELFKSIENKSAREVESNLVGISPLAVPRERAKIIDMASVEIRFVADHNLLGKFRRIRDLSIYKLHGNTSFSGLFGYMSDVVLDRIDPCKNEFSKINGEVKAIGNAVENKECLRTASPTSEVGVQQMNSAVMDMKHKPTTTKSKPIIARVSVKNSRYISVHVKREIWKRDQAQCAYIDPTSRVRCQCTFGLQVDHIIPFSMGGSSSDVNNLRLVCRTHNQWFAMKSFGQKQFKFQQS